MRLIKCSIGMDGHIGSSITRNSERRDKFFSLPTILLLVSFLELNILVNILLPDTVSSVKNQTLRLWESGYAEDQKKSQMVFRKNMPNSNIINQDNSTQETTLRMTKWLENSSLYKKKRCSPLLERTV